MNKRNSKLASIALAITVTSIGAGALISGSAIAGADVKGDHKATVSMVAAEAASGEAVQCTFDDVTFGGTMGSVHVGVATTPDGAVLDGREIHAVPIEVGSDGGFTVSVDGSVSGVTTFTGEAPVPVQGGSGSDMSTAAPEAIIGDGTALPDGLKVIDAETARTGTASECAALRETLSPKR